jgi:hypothetical protein
LVAAPDKLVKHGRFAHSGVYEYNAREMERLMGPKWPPPPEIGIKKMYQVYRPANVLISAVKNGMFRNMTLTRQHPPELWVDPQNWKDHAVGFTGDSAELEWVGDEVSVNGTVTLADSVAVEAYGHGVIDLSPGYNATWEWKRGHTSKGEAFDAAMTEVTDTNHLALVNKGRGGALSAIVDGATDVGRRVRQAASGLWWAVKRRTLIVDGQAGDGPGSVGTGFRSGLQMCADQVGSMPEVEIEDRVDQMKLLAADLPMGDEKSLLMRCLDDLKMMKMFPVEQVSDAIELACSLFDKLDRAAMGDAKTMIGDSAGEDDVKISLESLLGGSRRGKVKAADAESIAEQMGTEMPVSPAKGSEDVPTVEAKKIAETPSAPPKETDTKIPTAVAADEPDPSQPPAETPTEAPAAPAAAPVPAAPTPPDPDKQLAVDIAAAIAKWEAAKGTAQPAAPAPGAAPAAPAAAAAPAAPAAPAAAPAAAAAPAEEKKEPPSKEPPKATDSAPDPARSLTALISGGRAADAAPSTGLDGLVNSIRSGNWRGR